MKREITTNKIWFIEWSERNLQFTVQTPGEMLSKNREAFRERCISDWQPVALTNSLDEAQTIIEDPLAARRKHLPTLIRKRIKNAYEIKSLARKA